MKDVTFKGEKEGAQISNNLHKYSKSGPFCERKKFIKRSKKRGVRFLMDGLGSHHCERDRVKNYQHGKRRYNYAALLRIKKTFKASRPTIIT